MKYEIIVNNLLDILEHYLVGDNFPVNLHYGVNGYRLNSSPNFDHWNLAMPHNRDTDLELLSLLFL